MRIICIGLLAVFSASSASAADSTPHTLMVRLPDGAKWQQDFVTHRNGTDILPDTPLPVTLNLKASFSYALKVRNGGFSISRRTLRYNEITPLDTSFADLAKIRHDQAVITNDLDYGTDTRLKPQTLDNWTDIQSRSRALTVATLGEDMAVIGDEEEAANPDPKHTPQYLLAETLMPEYLMAELYLHPHVIGSASTRRDIIMSSLTGEAFSADITVTLDAWDEATDRAKYRMSITPVAEAKADAIKHYLADLLYPLHTMTEGEPEQIQARVVEIAAQSTYDDHLICHFSASIGNGFVTLGECREEMHLTTPLNNENVDVTFSLTQSLLP